MHNPSRTSIINRLRSWWEHHVLFEPKDWIQVAVTSRCNAACVYCPRTVYIDRWRDRLLPLDLFKRLVPAFHKTGLVYLQGWGEPLLHPHLPAMIAMAKATGARVGTTTNGMLLNVSLAEALVDAGLDIIAFSLAGTSAAYNDRIRTGTHLDTVMANIALLNRIKQQRRSATPRIHIAYMLLSSGLEEIKALPSLLKECNVRQVVVSGLDFVPSKELAGEILSSVTDTQRDAIEGMFTSLRTSGHAMGLDIHTPERIMAENEPCPENIQRAMCVSAEGEISPCVLANIPVTQAHFFHGREHPYHRMIFGNIRENPLPLIWRHPAYVHWRSAHTSAGEIPNPCTLCSKMFSKP